MAFVLLPLSTLRRALGGAGTDAYDGIHDGKGRTPG
jgi:hypothetical protein